MPLEEDVRLSFSDYASEAARYAAYSLKRRWKYVTDKEFREKRKEELKPFREQVQTKLEEQGVSATTASILSRYARDVPEEFPANGMLSYVTGLTTIGSLPEKYVDIASTVLGLDADQVSWGHVTGGELGSYKAVPQFYGVAEGLDAALGDEIPGVGAMYFNAVLGAKAVQTGTRLYFRAKKDKHLPAVTALFVPTVQLAALGFGAYKVAEKVGEYLHKNVDEPEKEQGTTQNIPGSPTETP